MIDGVGAATFIDKPQAGVEWFAFRGRGVFFRESSYQPQGIVSRRVNAIETLSAQQACARARDVRAGKKNARRGGRLQDGRGVRDEKAFTLIEVIVALAGGLLIIGLAYTVYAEASRHIVRWQQRVAAENALHLVLQRFSEDIRAAQHVQGRLPRTIMLSRERDSVRYTWKGGKLWRNGRSVVPAGTRVTAAIFGRDTSSASPVRTGGRLLRRGGGPPEEGVLLSLELSLSVGKTRVAGRAVARPRHAGPWSVEEDRGSPRRGSF